MSSYVPGGGYDAPQLVTVPTPPVGQFVTPIVTTIAGVTTIMESLFVRMLFDNTSAAPAPTVLVIRWADPTDQTIYELASWCEAQD